MISLHSLGLRVPSSAEPPPDCGQPNWVPLRTCPLVILVGVTGVGKSTALAALAARGVTLNILPNRREITDAVMIEPLAGRPVTDREERFRLTARYRETHRGGMAQALASLALDSARWPAPLLFDGLRGEEEVRFAALHLPLARFVALHAPDAVRVRRLLGREDAFDQVQTNAPGGDLLAKLRALPGVAQVFSEAVLAGLAALEQGGLASADILAKTKIVVSERRNYDPQAEGAFLQTLPPERALTVDTAAHGPDEVARRVQEWL